MDQIQPPAGRLPGAGQLAGGRSAWRRAAALATAVLIGVHGLLHLMGVALLWKLGQPGQLRYADAVPAPGSAGGYLVGGLWLVAALLFVAAAILLAAGRGAWRVAALAGVAVSASVIGLAPAAAAGGLVVDGFILLLAAVSWARARTALGDHYAPSGEETIGGD
jgi:hypothetical protein